MRLKDLLETVGKLRLQYNEVAGGIGLSRGDLHLRLRGMLTIISDLELLMSAADLAKDLLASHIYRTRQHLRGIVNKPAKRNLKPVRTLAEDSYSDARGLGYRSDFREWQQLISAGICGAM